MDQYPTNHSTPDYPEDGSNSVLPDAEEWAKHDDTQIETNLNGIKNARDALNGTNTTNNTNAPNTPNVPNTPSLQPGANTNVGSETYEQLTLDNLGKEDDLGDSSEKSKPKRVAFGGFVKPEMYDVFGDYDLSELSEQEKNWMTTEKLRELIMSPAIEYKFAVDGVKLNTYEYNLVVRSPEHLGRFAAAKTLGDNDLDDERLAAGDRAPKHVFESKLATMQPHLDAMRLQRSMVRELSREASKPGYAHKTEERMKELTSAAWNEFKTMLDVLHIERGWDDNLRNRADAALINYLTQGGQRDRVAHWQSMIELTDNYLTQRIALFNRRIVDLNRRIGS